MEVSTLCSVFSGCLFDALIASRLCSDADRLALSYNRLDDFSIDPTFSLLSRLRYLNLKGNNFAQFPSAVSSLHRLTIRPVYSMILIL